MIDLMIVLEIEVVVEKRLLLINVVVVVD